MYKLDVARSTNLPTRKRLKRANNINDYADLLVKPLRANASTLLINSTNKFNCWFYNKPSVPKDHAHWANSI